MVLRNGVTLDSSGTKQPYAVGSLQLPMKRLSRPGVRPDEARAFLRERYKQLRVERNAEFATTDQENCVGIFE